MTPSDQALEVTESDHAFAEPWQARAFAVAVLASRQGCFTWAEWTLALGRELRHAPNGAGRSGDAGYFNCWLAALQSLLIGNGSIGRNELLARKDAWEDAYRHTPHGVAVTLSVAASDR